MEIRTLGLITYQFPHLKTEQVLQRLLHQDFKLRMYALPFTPRKPRKTLFSHRPDQTDAVTPQALAEKHKIPYVNCMNDRDIDNSCDAYLILGAGILSPECVQGKKIINAHPGIIPSSRGLDSFKWAIYEMKPLGVTLHFIDAQVDEGEIISVIPTNIYLSDSITSLARRHYENEIDCLSRFTDYLDKPENSFCNAEKGDPMRRMPFEKESELVQQFSVYTEKFGRP